MTCRLHPSYSVQVDLSLLRCFSYQGCQVCWLVSATSGSWPDRTQRRNDRSLPTVARQIQLPVTSHCSRGTGTGARGTGRRIALEDVAALGAVQPVEAVPSHPAAEDAVKSSGRSQIDDAACADDVGEKNPSKGSLPSNATVRHDGAN